MHPCAVSLITYFESGEAIGVGSGSIVQGQTGLGESKKSSILFRNKIGERGNYAF
jgi:hypothetical protein